MAKEKTEKHEGPVLPKNEIRIIRVDDIAPDSDNPNYMTADQLDLLVNNINLVGSTEPILVVKMDPKENGGKNYQLISGEHRWAAFKHLGVEKIEAVIGDPKVFDEKTRKLQLVRMNKIKGQLNNKKFSQLVDSMIKSGQVTPEEAAYSFGFADEDEFDLIREAMRETLPDEKTKKQFDKKSKEAKSVDEIYSLVANLLKKYGEGIQANYMIIAVGRGRNMWVQLDGRLMLDFENKARACLENGVTFDSFMVEVMNSVNAEEFIAEHKDDLIETTEVVETIDDFFSYDLPLEDKELDEIRNELKLQGD